MRVAVILHTFFIDFQQSHLCYKPRNKSIIFSFKECVFFQLSFRIFVMLSNFLQHQQHHVIIVREAVIFSRDRNHYDQHNK